MTDNPSNMELMRKAATSINQQAAAIKPGSPEWLAAKSNGPVWEYQDARGVTHTGYMERFSDHGGTDVTYWFRDHATGELALVSGARLKAARRIK